MKTRCTSLLCLILFFGLQSCSSPAQQAPEAELAETPPAAEALRVLSSKHLRVWPTVDTSGSHAEVLAAVRRFFDDKMQKQEAEEQAYWLVDQYDQFLREYSELRYAEYNSAAEAVYLPTLLRIEACTPHSTDRLVTVRWAKEDSTGTATDVRYVFTFLAQADARGSYRLGSPLAWNTRAFARRQEGRISYRLSPKHTFSPSDAREQQAALVDLDAFFGLDPFAITFYSFRDPTELLQARGYAVHPLMHIHPTGGQAGIGDVLYSGNDRDRYTHEVVHLYLNRAYPTSTGLLNEGLATLLGGSSEQSYGWHAKNLREWLLTYSGSTLDAYLNPYQQQFIDGETSIPYTIGAAICKHLLASHGRDALDQALRAGADYWPVLNSYGITKAELRALLLEVLGD